MTDIRTQKNCEKPVCECRDTSNDGDEFDGRTYLHIRTHTADDGTEPLPAGLPGWLSPDITIIKPDATRGSEAVAGQVNQVEVVVNNRGGIDAINAYVDIFVADPSTASTPSTVQAIGGAFVNVYGYGSAIVTVPWVPTALDEGHRCLIARVSLIIPGDTYRNGNAFEVIQDRHVAQRNIHVAAFGTANQMRYMFFIVNPFTAALTGARRQTGTAIEAVTPGAMRRFVVTAREVRDPEELRHVAGAMNCGLAQFADRPLKSVSVALNERIHEIPTTERPRFTHEQVLAVPRLAEQPIVRLGRPVREVGVELAVGGVVHAVLQIERGAGYRRGDLHAVHVTQADERGSVCGGLTVIVRD